MRIAIHDYAGFSFPLELSIELSNRKHNVLHLFTTSSGGPSASFEKRSNRRLQIVNIDGEGVNKDNFIKRWLQERHYGDLAIKALSKWQPDSIISANTPLEAQKKIIDWAGSHAIPSVFWLHDLLSVAAGSIISDINPTLGRFAYNYLNKIEIGALSKANHIIAITDDFIPFLDQWGINPAKVTIIPNWGPIELIPVLPRNNPFSDKYSLDEKFTVLYSGTLGKKQDIKLIADTAAALAKDNESVFVVATDERGHHLLNQEIHQIDLSNLLRLPLQPSHLYPYLLASSDVSLITLKASAGNYCVPSKLWSAYCSQRASIVAVDIRNLCARITEEIRAGIVIPPGSVDKCIMAIKKLKNNESLRTDMGKNARKYAEKHFPISLIADGFETILRQTVLN